MSVAKQRILTWVRATAPHRETDVTARPQASSAPTSAIRRYLRIERPTFIVGLAFIVLGVLPGLLARLTGHRRPVLGAALTSIFHGRPVEGDDSWAPIGDALRYLANHAPDGLYDATYWHSSEQFIYSPLSLVFCRLTQFPPLLDWTSPLSLNHFFRGVLLANVFLITILFNDFYHALGANRAAPASAERAMRVLIPIGAALLFFPLMSGYWLGNVQTGLTFLMILGMLMWLRGHRVSVGVCMGLVCIFKPALAPLLLWAVLRREYRFIGGFLGVVAVFGLASLWMYGLHVHEDYLRLMSFLSKRGESYVGSSSINSLLNRAVFNGPNLEWDGTHSHIRNIPWIHWVTTLATLGFLAIAMLGRRQESPLGSWLDFAFAMLCINLASPVLYEHHLAFTLVPFMLAGLMLSRGAAGKPLLALGLAYFLMANSLEITDRLADTHWNFLQSYRLLSTLILLVIVFRLRSRESLDPSTSLGRGQLSHAA